MGTVLNQRNAPGINNSNVI